MMMAPGSAGPSGGVAQAMPGRLRTALAALLLVIGVADLAAVDTILVPRYLASRSRQAPASVAAPAQALARAQTPPVQPTPVQPTPAAATPPQPAAFAPEPAPASPGAEPAAQVEQPVRVEARSPTPSEERSWPRLLFAHNTAWLSPESCETLGTLAVQLKEQATLQAVLEGHTDNLGSREVNHFLSLHRAQRAQKWLVGQGVKPAQVEVRSFGASRPATPGRSAEARAQNRRVEITLRERSY
jgi:outer membrane protein OmpA-like peptidoglycan-associated protein